MKPLRSIRWRLQLWYGLLIAGLLAGFALTGYHFERSMRLERIDDDLQRLAFDVNTTLRRHNVATSDHTDPERRPPVPGPRLEDVFTTAHAARGYYVAIWTKNQVPFAPSSNAPANIPQPKDGPPSLRWRGTLREAYLGSNPGDVALAGRDLAPDMDVLSAFGWKLATGSLAILVATLLIGNWLVVRALRPIHAITDAAQKIATGDLSQRINMADTDSELGELAGVLNSTFSRLDASFAQQARFTADAAHELRTPVTVMLTHAQNGLAADALTAEQREAFEACQRAAQRMRRLIDSLLELSRLDAGQEAMKMARIDLRSLAAECVSLVRPLAVARRIEVEAELASAECSGDAMRLEQVITNLLANAIHHNHEGGRLRVRTGRENGDAWLVVADTGPGIPKEHLPHIFERFYRVDPSRRASGRTGLGLAISHAIIDAHGGEIGAQSEHGMGATFTVRLPATN